MVIRARTASLIIGLILVGAFPLLRAEPGQQRDQDALFNQAMQAYQQNEFKSALQLFQQINGSHAQEAKVYIDKIKTYRETFSAAAAILQRSPNEQDVRSVEYAIEELHAAIAIKADGPGEPDQVLQKALQLKRQMETAESKSDKDADRSLCERALAAANEHRFKEASDLSCLLAHDNPIYSCNGDEAAHVCQINTDLAKMEKTAGVPSAAPQSKGNAGTESGDLDKARAAYAGNDFARARVLLGKVTGDAKPAGDDLLYKISNYNDLISSAERLSRQGKYEEARTAFLSAAGIKSDGPGNPQNRAEMMELFLGVDQFYSGDYASAIRHLESCRNAGVGKPALVDFYLGASKLGEYFVTGGNDQALHQDALNDLKSAKQAGFDTSGHDVSPKILQAYNQL